MPTGKPGFAADADGPDLADAVHACDPGRVLEALLALLPRDASLAGIVAGLEPVLAAGWTDSTQGFVELLLRVRTTARADKQFALSDLIRDGLAELGLTVKDTADGQRVALVGS